VRCEAFDLLSLGEAPVGEEYFGSAVLIKEIGSISGAEDKPRRVIQVVDVDGEESADAPRCLVAKSVLGSREVWVEVGVLN
jgi:hypothetical protein